MFVCLSVFLSVRKGLSVDIFRRSWPIWMKITVYVAIGVESRTSHNQYNRTFISPNFRERDDFCNSLNPYISKTIKDIEKQRTSCRCKIWRSQDLTLYTFSISLTVFEIFRKNCFWKTFVRGKGSQKRLDLGQNTFKIFALTGNRKSPLNGTVGVMFPQN